MTYPYVKLDTRFYRHPKIAGLTDPAFRIHVCGLAYAVENLTDGIITPNTLPLITTAPKNSRDKAIRELVDRIIWVTLPAGNGWEIHDFLDFNWSRQRVDERRETNRNNIRKRWGP